MEKVIKNLSTGFPSIALIGPRQSGKTTLVKKIFPKKPYVLLEDPETQQFAINDPRGFLSQFPSGAVIDEAQKAPQLFSYLQGIIDKENKPGMFILTGSQNFLLMEKITQSLAGRIAILKLLPFSVKELNSANISFEHYEDYLFKGFYPRPYDIKIDPSNFYSNYVQTYLERDLRLLKNVHDLSTFHTFLKMCAHRTGQLVNLSSIANDCGINHNTAKAWLSLLETSFIVFLLRPYYKNYNKRLVKMPKLYFTDPGLASYLAGIQDTNHLSNHPLKGPLFETLVISELLKKRFNSAKDNNLYFWRDKTGHEIDCLIENRSQLFPIEIKSGRTISEDYFKNIKYWNKLSGNDPALSYIVYGGTAEQKRKTANILTWQKIYTLN
ncbi:MAG: ATP-binding protein [Candidatus Omnitrophota bacterium]